MGDVPKHLPIGPRSLGCELHALGPSFIVQNLTQSKISDLRHSHCIEEDICRLQVIVNDALGLLV